MAAAHSTSPEEQSQRSALREIFCNQRGLRSGWRLALYSTLILAMAFALHLVFSAVGVEESLPKTFSMAKALFFQFLFRGYTQFTLAEGISFRSAAVVLSALYMIIIAVGTGLNLIGLPIVFIVGLFCSLTLRRTHSLWFAIGMNAAFDFGATFLYSVPNHPLGSLSDHHLSEAALHGSAWLTGGTMGVERKSASNLHRGNSHFLGEQILSRENF
jgi:membrane protease YdiL (CAAX protease family)